MDIENLKFTADITHIIEHLTGNKGETVGSDKLRWNPCPFCGHNDCFTVFIKDGTFKCFSAECNKSGDVISFVEYFNNVDFPEAVKFICEYYNLNPDDYKNITRHANLKKEDATIQEIRRIAVNYYQESLFSDAGKPVLDYLIKKRGYSIDTLKHFQVGFTTGELKKHLESKGYKPENYKDSGLIVYRKYKSGEGRWQDQFPYGGIIFPHSWRGKYLHFSYKYNIDKSGKFIYKITQPNGEKYTSIQMKSQFRDEEWLVYNQDALDIPIEIEGEKSKIIIVEGEWEVLSFFEKAKFPNVIAIFGNTGNKQEQVNSLPVDFSYILAFDHDAPGESYQHKFGLTLFQKDIQVQILPYSKEHKDPDEWLAKSQGPTLEFRELMKNLERYIPVGEDGVPDPETNIYRKGNNYYMITHDKDTKKEKSLKITNFIIDFPVQYISETENGEINIDREFILKNELGETSKPTKISPDQLVVLKKFQAWAYSNGFFELTQNKDPILSNLRQYIHKRQARKNVYIRNQIGYLDDENIFLLGNAIVEPSGRIVYGDSQNIIWQYESKGFKPAAIDDNLNLPIVEKRLDSKEYQKLIDDITTLLIANYGQESIALAIGWFKASLFSDIIYNNFHQFPILWVYGVTKSGKNTLLELIYNLIGMEAANPRTMESVKLTWLYRQMAYFSNLPVWIDEHNFKNETARRECEKFYGPIRGIFNRIGKGMAVDASMKTRSFPINATLVVSGESLPSDVAVRNRCIIIAINVKNRNDDLYRSVLKIKPRFKEVFYNWITERLDPEFCKMKINRIHEIIKILKIKGITGREAENYAIIGAFTEDLFNENPMKKWLIDDFLSKEASAKFTRIEEENIMNQFNHDLEIMYIKKDYIIPEYFKTDKKNQLLYVYGSGVHSAWLSYRKREMFNATMNITYFEFLDIVREQEYFIKDGVTVNFDFPVNKKRALVFDISKLPDNYNQILESKGFTIDDDGKAKLLF
jgi:DNA primase catalytic core